MKVTPVGKRFNFNLQNNHTNEVWQDGSNVRIKEGKHLNLLIGDFNNG